MLSLPQLARQKWHQLRPRFYRKLQQSNRLEETVNQAVHQAQSSVRLHVLLGEQPEEALLAAKKKLVLYVPLAEVGH